MIIIMIYSDDNEYITIRSSFGIHFQTPYTLRGRWSWDSIRTRYILVPGAGAGDVRGAQDRGDTVTELYHAVSRIMDMTWYDTFIHFIHCSKTKRMGFPGFWPIRKFCITLFLDGKRVTDWMPKIMGMVEDIRRLLHHDQDPSRCENLSV